MWHVQRAVVVQCGRHDDRHGSVVVEGDHGLLGASGGVDGEQGHHLLARRVSGHAEDDDAAAAACQHPSTDRAPVCGGKCNMTTGSAGDVLVGSVNNDHAGGVVATIEPSNRGNEYNKAKAAHLSRLQNTHKTPANSTL